MKLIIIAMLFLSHSRVPPKNIPPAIKGQEYGKLGTQTPQKITLEESVKNYEKYKGKYVQIEGKVKDVCKIAGCWVMITDGKNEIRLSMKDYGFFVPKDAIGKSIMAEGYIETSELSVKQHKHYLEEQGKPKEEVDKIEQPLQMLKFYSHGIRVLS